MSATGYHQLPVTPYEPQQNNPVDQFARIAQLKAALQGEQVQKNQIQAGQQENQIRQQQINDQQAMTSAMHEWDGKDLNSLIPLAVKHGGSANAVMSLKSNILAQQEKYSTIAKNDAETGQNNLKTLQGTNDLIAGKIGAAVALPDEQIATGAASAVQEMATTNGPNGQPLMDPQHAQMAQQLLQSGDPAKIRQGLQAMQKAYMGQSAQMESAQKQAQAAKETSDTAKNNAELDYYKKNGGAPGVPEGVVQQNDWLAKNPGKGPSDYVAWKAKQAPLAQINVANAAGGGLTDTARDQAAEKYWQTGQLPPGARGTAGLVQNRQIMNRAAELHPEGSLAENSAEFKANENSLKHLQTNFDQVTAFENTALKNLDQLIEAGKQVPDLGSRFANVPVRNISANMIGTPEMARFKTALLTAQTEAGKVLSSANANGVLSDSARHEAQDILDGNLPFPAMVASSNQLKTDFGNRHQSYADQISDIKNRMGGKASSAGSQGGNFSVKAPNGKTYNFKDQQSLDNFKKAAGIQ